MDTFQQFNVARPDDTPSLGQSKLTLIQDGLRHRVDNGLYGTQARLKRMSIAPRGDIPEGACISEAESVGVVFLDLSNGFGAKEPFNEALLVATQQGAGCTLRSALAIRAWAASLPASLSW